MAQVWAFAAEGRLERVPVDDLVNYYEWLNAASIRKGYVTRAPWTLPPGSGLTHDDRGAPTDAQRMETFDDAVEKL